MIVFNSGNSSAGSAARAVGGSVTLLIRRVRSNDINSSPGSNFSCVARQSVAPDRKAMTISKMEASKLSEANCNKRALEPVLNV